jgi:hypothetical protein
MNTWTTDQEGVLERIRLNCMFQKRANTKLYLSYKSRLAMYKVPIIVISAVNSVTSVGLVRYLPQHIISASTCVLSLVVGIIGSLSMYLQLEVNQELALVSSKDFYNLAIDIHKTLSLNREHRSTSGKDYLDEVYTRYVGINDKSLLTKQGKNSDALLKEPTDIQMPRRFSLPYSADSLIPTDSDTMSDENVI